MPQDHIEAEIITLTKEFLAESGERYRREIKMDSSLQRHLGIDSLGRAELFRRVEKTFEVQIPDQLLAEAETLEDIAAFLYSSQSTMQYGEKREVISSHGERPHLDLGQANSLQDVLLMYGQHDPEKTHIYFQHEDGTDEVISYGHLLKTSQRVAYSLRERGLKEGDTVAIMLPTTPDFFYSFYGILLAGGIPVPIYPPFRMHMLEAYARTEARILRNAEVRMLITFDQAGNLSRLLQGFVPSLRAVLTVNQLMSPSEIAILPHAKINDPAFIQYTSGSTSDPKGVLLSHYNLLSNIRAYGKAVKVSRDDVTVSWLPLYHDFGLIGSWLGSLYFGAPLILMTPFSFLSHPERWLWAIHYHRGTISCAPNFAYELCVRKIEPSRIEGLDLSSWRIAANGAEKIYPRTLEMFTEKFAPYGFRKEAMMPVYGLAESTVGLTITPVGKGYTIDRIDRKIFEEEKRAVPATSKHALEFVACGEPIENHEIRIVDDEDAELPERHIGSLQFRGPSNMQGYYNNPRATKATIRDGWIDSGDLAYEADGQVYIAGRRKDLIVKAGRNLYPVEIEELVGDVEGVRQGCVAAFGVSSQEDGTEELVIVAETREKRRAIRDQIKARINEVVATALDITPDHIKLVAPRSVPKTSSGKLQRAACKDMYMENRLGKIRIPASVQMIKLGMEWVLRKLLDLVIIVIKSVYTAYAGIVVFVAVLLLYVVSRVSTPKKTQSFCKHVCRFLLRAIFCPLYVVNKAHMKTAGPVIYVANHASYIDALVGIAVVPLGTRFVAKKEVFSVPVLGQLLTVLGHLPLDRSNLPRGLEDTREIQSALQDGHSIFIFPEGTFGYAAGLRPFRLGAFKIAAESKVPVVPFAIKGARKILRDGSWLMRPNKLKVVICEAIKAKGSEWQDITQLRQDARARIAKYCGETSLDLIAANQVAPPPPSKRKA